jgi:hypothetical protein
MTAEMKTIFVFDFQSHATMHLNFNEGYLRMLCVAYPASRIVFLGGAGQIGNLSALTKDLNQIAFQACDVFKTPWGLSRHNLLAGRWAGYQCSRLVQEVLKGNLVQFVALLGEDSNLYKAIGMSWPRSSEAPLHMILHNHLGDAMAWRTRNPIFRAMDLVSLMQKPLPASVKLVALELGIANKIADQYPKLQSSVATLEHPILPSEWCIGKQLDGQLRVGFLGNASNTKGFDKYMRVVHQCADLPLTFDAIGIATTDSRRIDLSGLTRKPEVGGLARQAYMEYVRELDIVCLPLTGAIYDYVASGSVTDAIATLKPLIAFRNVVLDAVFEKYGEMGILVDDEASMQDAVESLLRDNLPARMVVWHSNLQKMRSARTPGSLAKDYLKLFS